MRAPALSLVSFLAVVGLLVGCGDSAAETQTSAPAPRRATIAYVVDGDTLRVDLDGALAYVRLVGIDTPEDVRPGVAVECGARRAASSMRRLAPEGAPVSLQTDSVAGTEDRYGRLLAHAIVGGRQLELEQLRRGWAEVYRYHGQRFDGLARFDAAEDSARRAGRGVWGICGGDFHSAG